MKLVKEEVHVADQQAPEWFGAARKYARRVPRHDMAAIRGSIARGRSREEAKAP